MLTAEDRKVRAVDRALEVVARGLGRAIVACHPDWTIERIIESCTKLRHFQQELFTSPVADPSTMLAVAIEKSVELGIEESELQKLRVFRNDVAHKRPSANARQVALDSQRVNAELNRGLALLEKIGCRTESREVRRVLVYFNAGAPEGTWSDEGRPEEDVVEFVPPNRPPRRKASPAKGGAREPIEGLSSDQLEVIARIRSWWATSGVRFVISGPAGTGKTRIVPAIVEALGLTPENVQFVAPTNKACEVLRAKLPPRAGYRGRVSTFHSLLFRYRTPERDGEDLKFTITGRKPIREDIRLLICDEASMLSDLDVEAMACYRTVFLGDPSQLPPVLGDRAQDGRIARNSEILLHPDVELTTIHRQSGGSILDAANLVRCGEPLHAAIFDDERTQVLEEAEGHVGPRELRDLMRSADAVLVARNVTRIRVNEIMRALKGHLRHPGDWVPKPGEPLVAIDKQSGRNGSFEGQPDIANGQQLVVQEVLGISKFANKTTGQEVLGVRVRAHFRDDPSISGTWPISQEMLVGRHVVGDEVSTRLIAGPRSGLLRCDWGYALTVHKSQGSEWGRVVVIDHGAYDRIGQREWNYVAITRARDHVTVVRLRPDSSLL
jgi:exodeoxyribonuclease-5